MCVDNGRWCQRQWCAMLLVGAALVCTIVVAVVGARIKDFSEHSGIITEPIDPDLFSHKQREQDSGANEEFSSSPVWTGIKSLNMTALRYEYGYPYQASITYIADLLRSDLKQTFRDVATSVVICPNLSLPPFNLTSPGLNGRQKLVVIGPSIALSPLEARKKVYDLRELAQRFKWDPVFICGAAGGPWPFVGRNSEAAINLSIRNGIVSQRSHVAYLNDPGGYESKPYRVEPLPANETRTALFGSYLFSDGKPGTVIKVVAKNRTGSSSFLTAIRESIDRKYGNNVVALGGTLMVRKGNVSVSIMPNVGRSYDWKSGAPEWLSYLEMPAPMVFVGILVSRSLKQFVMPLQHFHGWGPGGGGHFETDTTPDIVEYEGYFAMAEAVIRIDEYKSS